MNHAMGVHSSAENEIYFLVFKETHLKFVPLRGD
jgi:hypothetical protein